MRTTTTLLAVTLLAGAAVGCSSSDPSPAATKTVTASPSLSRAEARQACVDGWYALLKKPGASVDIEDKPAVCEGLTDQAGMYADALFKRNKENRENLNDCLDDPACTEWPVP